jgi:DNA-binding NarL/FixJ family response regulator
LFGAAETLRESIGSPVPPADRSGYDADQAALRANLDTPSLEAAWAAGRTAPLDQVIVEAQASAGPARPDSAPGARLTTRRLPGLTRREHEVVVLIARGYSNGQIGARLNVTRRTVETHVTAILSKLGVTSRAQVVVWAVDHGLRPLLAD